MAIFMRGFTEIKASGPPAWEGTGGPLVYSGYFHTGADKIEGNICSMVLLFHGNIILKSAVMLPGIVGSGRFHLSGEPLR